LPSQILSTQVITDEVWVRFLRAHAAVTRELSARLEASHGLTLSDFDVLVQLFHAEGHRLRRVDLARQVLLTASGITRLLDGLERAGWVQKARCDSDQRVTYAELTEAGLTKISEAREAHHRDIDELFGTKFSEDELVALDGLLKRLPLADTACQA
jgi:MarR family 2-MHQ and catechol resistance regulon transcriptional repressor